MRVWKKLPEWIERRREFDRRQIGFVPTMGALHRGHASLVERCRSENDVTVASIFVNPAQFNDPSDLERYPSTMEKDLALLESFLRRTPPIFIRMVTGFGWRKTNSRS